MRLIKPLVLFAAVLTAVPTRKTLSDSYRNYLCGKPSSSYDISANALQCPSDRYRADYYMQLAAAGSR